MQPEQQNQPSQTNPNIPDYLGMEPIKEPKQPVSKRKIMLLVGIPLLLIGLVILGLAAWSWLDGEPERRFHASLEKMLSQKYVSQSYTLSLNDKTIQTTSMQTDYTAAGSPSRHTKQARTVVDDENKPHTLKTEVLSSNNQELAARFESAPNFDQAAKTLVAGQWYKLSKDTPPAITSVLNVDIEDTKSALFGDLITGMFTDAQRQEIMKFIKNGRIYNVVESRIEKIDNQDTNVFIVDYDTQGIAELNKKVAAVLGLSHLPVQYRAMAEAKPEIKRVQVWVDATDKFVQTQFRELEDEDKTTVVATTRFSYPETLKIERPTDVKEF